MAKNEKSPFFTFKEKIEHYTGVANGSITIKDSDKYDASIQQAYARCQKNAMNAQNRHWRRKNSSKEEVKEYDLKRAESQIFYWGNKAKEDPSNERASKKAFGWVERRNKLKEDD